ncbi:MAG: hypothetical protein C5B50_15295 [Verrucomicrobia bacterium]|nr:MAG: hypothetical protein C5B50_15295 [Verrucomicrobiota bacterium]
MKKAWLALLVFVLLLVIAWTVWFRHGMQKQESLAARFRAFVQDMFTQPSSHKLDILGTTGTPVVVAYRDDHSHTEILHGTVPTNYTIRFRHRVDVVIKNVGTTNANLGFAIDSRPGSMAFRAAPSPGPGSVVPGSVVYPPFYGYSGYSAGNGWGGGGTVNPDEWPITLPPGMSKREAKRHDFSKEVLRLRVKAGEPFLEQNPSDQKLLAGAGSGYLKLKEYAAAEEMYRRFFATDCKDPTFLNGVVYQYAENGGTNLGRAYELALKARNLAGAWESPLIDDTGAWIQMKRGYYKEALNILARLKFPLPNSSSAGVGEFHLGMAHYMLMEEDAARAAFQKVPQTNPASFEQNEARKCLEMLNLNAQPPTRKVIAKLKARLIEAPDDPVALSRLGNLYELAHATPRRPPEDPLVMKALGVNAYHRGQYSQAIEWLTMSGKSRTTDPDLFLYLGRAQNQLNQTNAHVDSLRKAMALGLKPAQVEEVNNLLAPFRSHPDTVTNIAAGPAWPLPAQIPAGTRTWTWMSVRSTNGGHFVRTNAPAVRH